MDDEFVIVQLDTKSHRRELQISSVIAGPLGASAKTGFNAKKQTNLLVTKRDDGGLDLNPVRDLAGGEYLIMTEEVPQKVYDFSIK